MIDQGKETVLRVDDDADWSRETERDKVGGGGRSRKRKKKDEGRKVMEAGSCEAEGKNGDWLGGRRFRLQ